MPNLSSIGQEEHAFYKFPSIKWFSESVNHSGLAKGGIYLLSGSPGSGKTTLALEMMVDLASVGHKILYVALEQPPAILKNAIEKRIIPNRKMNGAIKKASSDPSWKGKLDDIANEMSQDDQQMTIYEKMSKNFYVDSSVAGMEGLSNFLITQVLTTNAQYKGIDVIVVDSLQGLGTAPTSSKPYAKLYEFNRYAKDEGITCILIGHVTKSGQVAGPRSLEHNVDCVMYLRKAMRLRPLFVPKNRFGPERHEPFSLITNKYGCLEKSKHMTSLSTTAYGYIPNADRFIEVQALVKLPKFGARPGLLAPYLPRTKLQQLIGIVSSIKDVDLSDLTFEINCYIPSGGVYTNTLDFPLAVSMLSSYFQQSLPSRSLFLGELDLTQQIRPLSEDILTAFVDTLRRGNGMILPRQVYLSNEQVGRLRQMIADAGVREMEVIGVENLEKFIVQTWPEIIVSD